MPAFRDITIHFVQARVSVCVFFFTCMSLSQRRNNIHVMKAKVPNFILVLFQKQFTLSKYGIEIIIFSAQTYSLKKIEKIEEKKGN